MTDNKIDVRVYPIAEPQGATRAFASVAIDDLIVIRGIRIVEGSKGLFISMPQTRDKDGNFRDIAFPISGDLRKHISKAAIGLYESDAIDPLGMAAGHEDGGGE